VWGRFQATETGVARATLPVRIGERKRHAVSTVRAARMVAAVGGQAIAPRAGYVLGSSRAGSMNARAESVRQVAHTKQ
jgi:hypothetical protein